MVLAGVTEVLRTAVDWLARPAVLYTSVLLVLLLGARTRLLWRRSAGLAFLVLGMTALALAATDGVFRQRLLDPRHLPVAVWTLLTLAALWLALHRAAGQNRREPAEPVGWSGPSRSEWTAAVAAVLALMAVAASVKAPFGAPTSGMRAVPGDLVAVPDLAASEPAKRPWFVRFTQETAFYFDPWFADVLLPLLLLAALLALPFLDRQADGVPDDSPRGPPALGAREQRLLLLSAGTLVLVLLPTLVATYLRGPHWNVVSPFEPWAAAPPQLPPAPLSELFWCGALGRNAPPAFWLVRELPGLAALSLYFVVLPRQLSRFKATRGIFERYRRTLGPWRYSLARILALFLMTVPLKMYGRWLFGVGYWLDLPEIAFSF